MDNVRSWAANNTVLMAVQNASFLSPLKTTSVWLSTAQNTTATDAANVKLAIFLPADTATLRTPTAINTILPTEKQSVPAVLINITFTKANANLLREDVHMITKENVPVGLPSLRKMENASLLVVPLTTGRPAWVVRLLSNTILNKKVVWFPTALNITGKDVQTVKTDGFSTTVSAWKAIPTAFPTTSKVNARPAKVDLFSTKANAWKTSPTALNFVLTIWLVSSATMASLFTRESARESFPIANNLTTTKIAVLFAKTDTTLLTDSVLPRIPTAKNTHSKKINPANIALSAKMPSSMILAPTNASQKLQDASTKVVTASPAFNLSTTMLNVNNAGFLAAKNTVWLDAYNAKLHSNLPTTCVWSITA